VCRISPDYFDNVTLNNCSTLTCWIPHHIWRSSRQFPRDMPDMGVVGCLRIWRQSDPVAPDMANLTLSNYPGKMQRFPHGLAKTLADETHHT
jgi:hypothetical protein